MLREATDGHCVHCIIYFESSLTNGFDTLSLIGQVDDYSVIKVHKPDFWRT